MKRRLLFAVLFLLCAGALALGQAPICEPGAAGCPQLKERPAPQAVPAAIKNEFLSADDVRGAMAGWGTDRTVFIAGGFWEAQGARVPNITIYTAEAIIAMNAASAKKQYLKYSPTDEDRRRALTVVAEGYVGARINDGCENVTRVILLSDDAGKLVEEAYLQEPLAQSWGNAYGAKTSCNSMRAKFSIAQVNRAMAAAPKGEFLIAVFAGSSKATYRVKAKYFDKLGL
jgi:hypothetical protein